jgi:hypothetical protein
LTKKEGPFLIILYNDNGRTPFRKYHFGPNLTLCSNLSLAGCFNVLGPSGRSVA